MKIIATLILCLSYIITQAQNHEEIEQKLIGEWSYIKTIDSLGNNVEAVNKYNVNGKETKIIASGPYLIINSDKSYTAVFSEIHSDTGNWELISKDEIEYEIVIPKESRQGRLIIQTQKILNKKWRQDDKRNFLDEHSEKILLLTDDRMEIEYETYYKLIYNKVEN